MTRRLAWLVVGLALSALLWVGSAGAQPATGGPWESSGWYFATSGDAWAWSETGAAGFELMGCVPNTSTCEPVGSVTFPEPVIGYVEEPVPFSYSGEPPVAIWFSVIPVPGSGEEPVPQLAADTFVLALGGLAAAFWLSFIAARLR